MNEKFETVLDEVITDYIDETLSASEREVFEEIMASQPEIKNYTQQVMDGRNALRALRRKQLLLTKNAIQKKSGIVNCN